MNSPSANQADSAGIAMRWFSAVGSGDVATAVASMTDNAVLISGSQCPATAPCIGMDSLQRAAQEAVAAHMKFALSGMPEVVGSGAVLQGTIQGDPIKAAGADQIKTVWDVAVQGGRIAALVGLSDISDAPTAKYVASAAVASASVRPSSDQANLAAVASRWFEVVNSGNTNAAATLFTEKAAFIGGPPCQISAPCIGPTAIAKRIQSAVASHHKESPVGDPLVAGNVVQMSWEVREDLDGQAGVERILWLVQATIQGDKIAAWIGTHNYGDAQTVKFNRYLQSRASAPPKPSAPTSAGG